MECPSCKYSPLPPGAQWCPKCATPVEIAAGVQSVVSVRVDVKENEGNVIGLKAGAIHGDVSIGSIHQVQVYALSADARDENWTKLPEAASPYFLSPFGPHERKLFYGREAQIERVMRRIARHPLAVLYGPLGVGKTSLLTAGLIPKLVEYGALVVRLPNYGEPLDSVIRAALQDSEESISVELAEGLPLPHLLKSIVEQAQGTIMLVLDHFEEVLDPSFDREQRDALLQDLAQTLDSVEPWFLRVILVVDSLDQLGKLQDQLPTVLECAIEVPPLTWEEAQEAIVEPLAVLGHPGGASYVGDLVSEWLVPDLDGLTPHDPGHVQPGQLQIVCRRLYEEARARNRPPQPAHINEELYRDLKRAEGIIHRHVDDTLLRFGEQRVLAKQILEAMAFPGLGPWVTPERLSVDSLSPPELRPVLTQLVDKDLLDQRMLDSRTEYAFTSPAVKEGVRRQAPDEVRRRYQAAEDLTRVWSEWVAHESPAKRSQLHYLAEADPYLSPSATQVLLLLSSAVVQSMPTALWLKRIREEGRELIRRLDEGQAEDEAPQSEAEDEAQRLLGLGRGHDAQLPERPADAGDLFGEIAWSAVHHGGAQGQTAALALTARHDDPRKAVDDIDWALHHATLGSWRRFWRGAELRGILADSDPQIDRLGSGLPPWSRVGMGLWRAWRRLRRDVWRIVALTLGGAIGAGAALGLVRFVLALVLQLPRPGAYLEQYLFVGTVMGAALCLGMAVAEAVLRPMEEPVLSMAQPRAWSHPLWVVVLGALLFGLGHALHGWIPKLSLAGQPLLVPLGLLFGLGLSVAVYDRPLAGRSRGRVRMLQRLALSSAVAVVTQAISELAAGQRGWLTFAWSGALYETRLELRVDAWWPTLEQQIPSWHYYLGLLDAAVVGAAMAGGILVGLILAADRLTKWRDLSIRAGE
jgi:hypothetical protein